MKDFAIAIFVKTPGLSPIKTRLKATTDQNLAFDFYHHAIEITKEVIQKTKSIYPHIFPYWAVTEQDGLEDPRWQDFPRLWQNEGELGQRLAYVYRKLLKQHKHVCLIGSDAPLLSIEHFEKAYHILNRSFSDKHKKPSFVIGPALDGGFYLFAGSHAISDKVWIDTPYSQPNTCAMLKKNLNLLGEIEELDELSDVDTKEDLLNLSIEKEENLLESQKKLMRWLKANL